MKKKWIFFLLAVGIVFLLLIGHWVYQKKSHIFIPRPASPSSTPRLSLQEKLSSHTPFSIVLLGYGGEHHDGTYLTDSIILAHIDPKTKRVTLISIPRDLYVRIPSDTQRPTMHKINAAYAIGLSDEQYPHKPVQYTGAHGGAQMVEDVVSVVTGLTIDGVVGIDFSSFVQAIDAIGGVDVDVQTAFDDPLYPIEGKETDLCDHSQEEVDAYVATASSLLADHGNEFFPCRYERLQFSAGTQHMDGSTALKYARSRHSTVDGSDFGRSRRQKQVLLAAKNKLMSASMISNIPTLLSTLSAGVMTNLTPSDVQSLVSKKQEFSSYDIQSYALSNQNYLYLTFSADHQSILIPRIGAESYGSIHTWISQIVQGKQEPTMPTVKVFNATSKQGLGWVMTQKLQSLSIQTANPETLSSAGNVRSIIQVTRSDLNQDIVQQIKSLLPNALFSLATPSASWGIANVSVKLGQDAISSLSTGLP